MATKKSIFERSEQALTEASADGCEKLIGELQELVQTEEAEMSANRPPGERVVGGDGRTYGELPPGAKYQKAALEGGDTVELEAAYNRLGTRVMQARQLIESLKARKKTEAEREAVEAAPGRAQEIVDNLDNLIDQHQAARETLAEIHSQLDESVKNLASLRELNPDSPSLSIEGFYRAGLELSYQPPQRRTYEESYGGTKPAQTIAPLFGYPTTARSLARRLIEPDQSILEKIRARLGIRTSAGQGLNAHYTPDQSDRAVRDRLSEWYTALVDTLTRGDLESAKQLQAETKASERPKVDGFIDLTQESHNA